LRSTVTPQGSIFPPPSYPCLKRRDKSPLIVMFTGPGRGFVVHEGSERELGYYSENWSEDLWFTPLDRDEVVTLANS
jgi:hypothetical protein